MGKILGLVLVLSLFLLPLVSAVTYSSCEIYGNCKPVSTASIFYNNTYQNITNVFNNITQINNITTPMDYTNIMMQNNSNNVTGNFKMIGGNVTGLVNVNSPVSIQTATMTSDTAPSGIASASDIIGAGYEAYYAFNKVYINDDAWFSSDNNVWPKYLQYQFPVAKTINKYTIYTRNGAGNDNRKPRNWNFLGSNDGSSWVQLDAQTNQFDATSTFQSANYSFSNTIPYSYYRINISANWGGGVPFVAIGELELYSIGSVVTETTVISLVSSSIVGENGILTVGDSAGRTLIQGANVTLLNNVTGKSFFGIDLGSSILRWIKGWFIDLDVSNNLLVGNNVHIDGNISVKRPYWNGYDNSTQNFLNTANIQVMNISNNLDYDSYGIHVVGQQNLTFDSTGDYLCLLSPEFYQASGLNKIITFWYQKNGVDVKWSNSRFTIDNEDYTAPAIPYQFDIENPATDNIRFMWYSDSTATMIYSSGALTSPTRPSIPGIILNCQTVSEIT